MRILLAVACVIGCKSGDGRTKIADEKGTVTLLAASDQAVVWTASRMDATELLLHHAGATTTISKGFVFALQVGPDAVYWADGDHIWRSSFDGKSRSELAEISEVKDLHLDGEILYWVTKDKLGRTRDGGASEVLHTGPGDGTQNLEKVVASGTTLIVASTTITQTRGVFDTELWRMDGAALKLLARAPGKFTQHLALDGDRVLWTVNHEVLEVRGDGPGKPLVDGRLIAARGGTTVVDDMQRTVVLGARGRRHLPRCLKGALMSRRLYCKFADDVIGSIAVE